MKSGIFAVLAIGVIWLVGQSAPVGGQEKDPPEKKPETKPETKAEPDVKLDPKKVYRNVTPEKLEDVFKAMKLTVQKVKGKEDGVTFYDYEKTVDKNTFKIRLHNYQGKDLWIDAHFTDKLPLEEINKWNVRAKFSRAVLLKGDKETVSLESQLDCVGGTTDFMVRLFIERFDGELREFAKFLVK